MNDRINQLLSQAYDEAVPETWTTLSSEQLGRIYDKFAELIVGECAERLMQDDFGSVKGVMSIAGARLKQHFGVEE